MGHTPETGAHVAFAGSLYPIGERVKVSTGHKGSALSRQNNRTYRVVVVPLCYLIAHFRIQLLRPGIEHIRTIESNNTNSALGFR